MGITLIKESREVINIKSLSINRSITSCVSAFNLTIAPSLNENFPISTGDRLEFVLTKEDNNGNILQKISFLKAFVEQVQVRGSASSHSVTIIGRDFLCDFVDSSVIKTKYKTPVNLKDLCSDVMSQNHMSFPIVDQSHVDLNFPITQKITASIGQKGYTFLQKYANTKQVYLLSDRHNNLTIQRTGEKKLKQPLKNTYDDILSNNIETMSFSVNDTGMFHEIDVISQDNITSKGSGTRKSKSTFTEIRANTDTGTLVGSPDSIGTATRTSTVARRGASIDPSIRNTKRYVMTAEESSTSEECTKRAKFEQNARRYKGFTYTCTVDGYFNGDDIYDVNQQVRIKDDYADIDTYLIIKNLTFHYDLQNGESTELTLTYQDALAPSPYLPARKERTNKNAKKYKKSATSFTNGGLESMIQALTLSDKK